MADGPVGGSWRGSTWWASSCDKTGVRHGVGGKHVASAAVWAAAATAWGWGGGVKAGAMGVERTSRNRAA